jgi:putative sporulation protein YyaC
MQEGRMGLFSRAVQPQEEKFEVGQKQVDVAMAGALQRYLAALHRPGSVPLVLCIGTDRSIGDALGPLVGSFLEEVGDLGIPVLGTLDAPVHASNLQENLDLIENKYRLPLIVAVDACLGRLDSVGVITVGKGSLKPGAGVNKNLPSVGQVYITGVVNVGGFMEYFVLQNTRLNLVMRMAKTVAAGISLGLRSWQGQRAVPPWTLGLRETFEG